MKKTRRLAFGALTAFLVSLTAAPSAAHADPTVTASPTSFVTLIPSYGAPGSQTYLFNPSTGDTINLVTQTSDLQVEATGDNRNEETFELAAPTGSVLHDGTYSFVDINPDHHHAGFDVSGDGSGCTPYQGHFTIRDIHSNAAHEVDRLSMTFLAYCGPRPLDPTFGEVKVNEPTPKAGLVFAPDRFAFPTIYSHTAIVSPLTVINTGAHRQTIRAISLTGASRKQFAFVSAGCVHATLNPTAECQGALIYQAANAKAAQATLDFSDTVSAKPQTLPVTGHGYGRHTSWTDRGRGSLDTLRDSFSPVNATIVASGTDTQATAEATTTDGNEFITDAAQLTAGTKALLRVGHTYVVTKNPDGPTFSVTAHGLVCDLPGSSFRVQQATFSSSHQLEDIAFTFTATCNAHSELIGSIAYRAPRPASPVPR